MVFNGKDRNYAIDWAKIVCSLLVFSIHVKFFGENPTRVGNILNFVIQNYLARISVPFFFITTGYFLSRKMPPNCMKLTGIKRYIMKLLRLYVVWSIIYLPVNIITILQDKEGILHGILTYVMQFVFSGSYSHLWYLNASIFAVCLLSYLLFKARIKLNRVMQLALIFYIIGLFGQSYYGFIVPLKTMVPGVWHFLKILQMIITTTRNGLFEGLLFVGIGVCIERGVFTLSRKQSWAGFLISMLLLLLEVFTLEYFHISRMHDMYLFLIPSSSFLFCAVRGTDVPYFKYAGELWKISTLIFLLHRGVALVVNFFLRHSITIWINTPIRYFLVLFITLTLSIGIVVMSETHFSWMKKLYA